VHFINIHNCFRNNGHEDESNENVIIDVHENNISLNKSTNNSTSTEIKD
jgi:hypothetical protein